MNRGIEANPGFESVDTPNPESPFVVKKFGGRSVASASNWSSINALLRERINEGLTPVVVHSAIAGISNTLEELLLAGVSGGGQEQLDRIEAVGVDMIVVNDGSNDDTSETLAQWSSRSGGINRIQCTHEVNMGKAAAMAARIRINARAWRIKRCES